MISAGRRRARYGRLAGLALSLLSVGHLSAETTTTYRYDALGRLLSAQDSNGPVIYYDYDAAGNRTYLSNAAFGEIRTATFSASSNAGGFGGLDGAGEGMRDGNFRGLASIFATNEEDGAWIRADLGAVRNVDTIDLVAASFDGNTQVAANRGKPFALASLTTTGLFAAAGAAAGVVLDPAAANGAIVEYSQDGAAYTPLATVSGMSVGSCKAVNFNGVTARYIRLRQPTVARMALGEFRVFTSARPQNRPPVAGPDAETLTTASVTVSPLANDSDPDGDPLVIISVGALYVDIGGTATINNGETITYTRRAGEYGPQVVPYTVADCRGATATGTITFTGGEPPNAVDDSVFAMPDTINVFDVLRNDTNFSGTHLKIVGKTDGAKGAVAIDTDVDFDAITYTPAAGATGADSFTYTVSNGAQATATVSVVIQPGNHAPVANNDVVQVPYEGFVDIRPMDNDTDADGDTLTILRHTDGVQGWATPVNTPDSPIIKYGSGAGKTGTDHFTYTIADGHGAVSTGTITTHVVGGPNVAPKAVADTVAVAYATPTQLDILANDTDGNSDPLTISVAYNGLKGSVAIAPDGKSVTYTPNAGALGADSFRYDILDGRGGQSNARVSVTISPRANIAPVAVNDDVGRITYAPVTIDVAANDSDADGDTLTVTARTNGQRGTTTWSADGKIVYTPSGASVGADSFTYTIGDGFGGTATGTVFLVINAFPVAVNDTGSTPYSTAAVFDLVSNDHDADGDVLTITTVNNSARSTKTINPDGRTITYTPALGFPGGPDSFGYIISDGHGGSISGSVIITVGQRPNTAPTLVTDNVGVINVNATTPFDVLANDTDADGDSLKITQVTNGAKGTVTINAAGDRVIYDPATFAAGPDSFTYTVSDGFFGVSTGTVNLVIDTKPVAVADSGPATYNLATVFDVLANDTDVDSDALVITAATNGAKGTVAIAPNGKSLTYTSNLNVSGADSFTYTISDGRGGVATGNVAVAIQPRVNLAPTLGPDTLSTGFGVTAVVEVLANDTDPEGDVLTITDKTNGAKGAVTINAGGKSLTYAPNGDAAAVGADTFTYTVSDGFGGVATATVSVTIQSRANVAPVAVDDTYGMLNHDVTAVLNVAVNDGDPDGDMFTITAAGPATKGVVTINPDGGALTYNADAAAFGPETFTYTISDAFGGSATATVSFTIDASPVAVSDTASVAYNTPLQMRVLDNDTDPEGDELFLTVATNGTKGAVGVDASGKFLTYSPYPGSVGTDSFTYTVVDVANGAVRGGSATGTVTVTIQSRANTAPVVANDSFLLNYNVATALDVRVNDTDADGDFLLITSVTNGAKGAVTINSGGQWLTYAPTAGATGPDSFTYTVSDGFGGVVTATVDVVNDSPPVAVTDNVAIAFNTATMQIDVLANDTDVDGDELFITAATNGTKGGAGVYPDGKTVYYNPAPGLTGTDSFTYTIVDFRNGAVRGGTTTGTVSVTLQSRANTDPVVGNDSFLLNYNVATALDVRVNDTDADGDFLLITSVTNGAKGAVTINSGGQWLTYAPTAGATGPDSFTYTVSDGFGGVVTATVDVVNDSPPVAVTDNVAIAFNTATMQIDVLANDTDVDGDELFITAATNGTKGGAGVYPDGKTVYYNPVPGLTGTDSFTYTIVDFRNGAVRGGTTTGTVSVTLQSRANTAPTLGDDIFTIAYNLTTAFDVLANDSDADGDPMTITAKTNGTKGVVTVAADKKSLSYNPGDTATGPDSFTYTVADGFGGQTVATVSVTIQPRTNVAPVAVDDDYGTIGRNTTTAMGVLANDSDGDADVLNITAVTPASKGVVTINTGSKGLTYNPDDTAFGADTFSYTISDGFGGAATATVAVVINAIPTAVADSMTAAYATPTQFDVLANDSDGNGDPLVITARTNGVNGLVAIAADGKSVTYTPRAGVTGTDSFTYTISDGRGTTATASVSVIIQPRANTAPTLGDDSFSIGYDVTTSFDVLANDTDLENDALTITGKTNGAKGVVAVATGGKSLSYNPNIGTSGADSFTYTVSDGFGGTDTATVSVTSNAPAVAVADTVSVAYDTAAVLDVLSNDSDADGDLLIISANSSPAKGVVAIAPDAKSLTYTPNTGLTGADSFTYTINDGKGSSATATVSVTIQPRPNTPPALGADDLGVINFNATVVADVLANDTDAEGDNLTITARTSGARGLVTIAVGGKSLTYKATTNAAGPDSFTYTVSDGFGGTSTATVSLVIDNPPAAVADSGPVAHNTATAFNVLANDTDANGDALVITGVTNGAKGGVTIAADGKSLTYTPNFGVTGTDSFTYTISDGRGGSATGGVTVTIAPRPNTAPTPAADAFTIGYNVTTSFDVLANDTDAEGDALTINGKTNGAQGTVTINAGLKSVTYNPNDTFTGTDSFIYTVIDGFGGVATATVSVTVQARANTAPVLTDDDLGVIAFNTPSPAFVLENDTDADLDLLNVIGVTNGAKGTVVVTAPRYVTYTPAPGATGPDSFTYTASDRFGGVATATVNLVINSPPVAGPDSANASTGTPLQIQVLANDTDADGDELFLTVATNGVKGNVSVDASGKFLTYSPKAGGIGADTFTYTVVDVANGVARGAQATGTVSVNIQQRANTAPVAANDAFSLPYNAVTTLFDVLANDIDAENDPLIITTLTNGAKGVVSLALNKKSLSYNPTDNAFGLDSFTYTVADGFGGVDTATVTVDIEPRANVVPVAVNDDYGVIGHDVTTVFSVLTNDTDADTDPLFISSVTQGAKGVVTIAANARSLTYNPDATAFGPETFTYTASDRFGGFATATVTLTINAIPVAVADSVSTPYNTPVQIDVLANDIDGNGDPLAIVSKTNGARGAVAIAADGKSVTYTPNPGVNGVPDTFTYTISDGRGGTVFGTVSVNNVPRPNTPPALGADAYSIGYDVTSVFDVLVNDTDAENDPLKVTGVTNGSKGVVTITGSGQTVTYNPTTGLSGADSFTYTVSDGFGGVATATVSVVSNTPPLALADSVSTPHGVAATFNVLANDADANGDGLVITGKTNGAKGVVAIAADGLSVTYAPNPGAFGTDSFTYTISDGHGSAATGTVSVTITTVAPVAVNDDMGSIGYDKTTDVNVVANDSDPDGDALSVISVRNGTKGVTTINPGGQSISYNPSLASGPDSFTYTVSDGFGGTAIGTVSVTIRPNAAPVAVADTVEAAYNTATLMDVLVNDTDADGDPLTIAAVVANGSKGTASISGTKIQYVPRVYLVGADTFTYRISDGRGATAETTVSVTIPTPPNTSPTAGGDDGGLVVAGTAKVINVLGNDSDAETPVTISSVGTASQGTVINSGNGTVTYTAYANASGTDTFQYTIADGWGGFATGVVNVTINRPPAAVADSFELDAYNAARPLAVLANDTDDGPVGNLTIQSVGTPSRGSVYVSGGVLMYTRSGYDPAQDTFSYTISDGLGGTATGTISVRVSPLVNIPPTAGNDSVAVSETGQVLTIPVLSNDTDLNYDTLTIDGVGTPSKGTVSISGNNLIYTRTSEDNLGDSFSYSIRDGRGGFSTAIVTVAINRVLVAKNDAYTIAPGEGGYKEMYVMDNDKDPNGRTLSITGFSLIPPIHGNLSYFSGTDHGKLVYRTTDAVKGNVQFTYTISNGAGGTATATVTITVQ